jgi:predicted RNA-binding Zn ribbon-like protein
VAASYSGPLRREPLAIELHNTLYVAGGRAIDGLETKDGLSAWLAGLTPRLPAQAREADASRHADFLALRGAVRDALHAGLDRKPVPAAPLELINEAAARAPSSPRAVTRSRGGLRAETSYHGADPTDVALAALAADAIELLAGPGRESLRACGAPGCILMFVKDHPRRTWCSGTCGNRARQARHYERTRRARR